MTGAAGISILQVASREGERDFLASLCAERYPGALLPSASDGACGLELFREFRPEIAIIGLELQTPDGIGLAAAVKALVPEVVVIALVAPGETGRLFPAIAAGVDHYLLSPVEGPRLFALLDRAVDRVCQARGEVVAAIHASESEERYRRLFEVESDAIFLADCQTGRILDCNLAAQSMYGYSREAFLLMQTTELSAEPEETRRVVAQMRDIHIPMRTNLRSDGTLFRVEITLSFFDYRGRAVYVAAVRDLTARLQAEEALRESENRYRMLFNFGVDAIFVFPVLEGGTFGTFLEVNDTACGRLGYSRDELLRLSVTDINVPLEAGKIGVRKKSLLRDKQIVFETIHLTKDGRQIPVEVSTHLFELNGQLTAMGIARDIALRRQSEEVLLQAKDQLERRVAARTAEIFEANSRLKQKITEQIHAEKALRESELLYRSLFENMLDGFAHCQMLYDDGQPVDFLYCDVNSAFGRLTGLQEVVGKKVSEVIPGLLKSTPELFERYGRVASTGRADKFEIFVKPLERWFSISAYSPQPDYFVAVFDNITERKQLELQLIQAKKLEAIGQIVGGVAHEVRNPLNAILSVTEALFNKKQIRENPKFDPFIHHIRVQVNRLAALMTDLLELGKPIPVSQLQAVPLRPVCREAVKLLELSGSLEGRRIELLCSELGSSCLVRADNVKLQQVLINLLENALQHSPAGGVVVLQLDLIADPAAPGGMVLIRVRDHGCGIRPDRLARVFEPFYTGREGGTGLGLALVRHYVNYMGGEVALRNNDPSPGCTAEVRLLLEPEEHP